MQKEISFGGVFLFIINSFSFLAEMNLNQFCFMKVIQMTHKSYQRCISIFNNDPPKHLNFGVCLMWKNYSLHTRELTKKGFFENPENRAGFFFANSWSSSCRVWAPWPYHALAPFLDLVRRLGKYKDPLVVLDTVKLHSKF